MRNLSLTPLLMIPLLFSACTSVMVDPAPMEPPAVIPLPPDSPVSNQPGGTVTTPSPETPVGENLVQGPVYLDSADLLILESFPLQFRLVLKGNLPDPCHELKVVVPEPDTQGVIAVQVFSLADPGKVCIQVLEPFEESVSLDGFPPGTYTVEVNGEEVGQIEVSAPQTSLSMKGYELYSWQSRGQWWFSMLLGTNRAKTLEEIVDPALALQGVEALEEKLSHLPEGEFVTWLPLPSGENIDQPPLEMVEEIGEFCVSRGLMCYKPEF